MVYLDSAATSQKPRQVIEAINNYYVHHNANVHRGVHVLSDESTQAWQDSRQIIAGFFSADPSQLILTRNATESLNGVAYGWADHNLEPEDVIAVTHMEHHANFVVWQQAAKRNNARLHVLDIDEQGRLDLEKAAAQLAHWGQRLKLVALTHVSNTTGVVNPVEEVIAVCRRLEKKAGQPIRVVVDGAQSAPHLPVDFQSLDVDFFVFSGHKMLGPMGVGGLLVKHDLLTSGQLRPWLFGGGMISAVFTDRTDFHPQPDERFTAGTPDVASAAGLAAACRYLQALGMDQVEAWDRQLVSYALERLGELPEIELIGPTQARPGAVQLDRVGSVAFLYRGVHAHDVAQVLDSEGVEVRSGHHCTMPLHLKFGWQATTRASFQVYSTKQDIDRLLDGLSKVKQIFVGPRPAVAP